MSSPITSPQTTLTGSSTFAGDLQTAVNRALNIASLPSQLLTADQNKVNGQITELGQIGSLFSTLQDSIQSLASGSGGNSLTATASDGSVLQANVSSGALSGTYTIDVLDPGASASALSNAPTTPVSDPFSQNISASGAFTLTVGSTTYAVQPATPNLNALAAAINSLGAPVHAVVVNLGSPAAPDYRLIIQSTALNDVALQLNDGANNSGNDLLSSLTTGSNALYTVNGQPPQGISSDSKTVTIGPGLNVTIQSAGVSDVTVAASTSAISKALSSFVDAYNGIVAELQKNRGQGGGTLTGDSGILSMQDALRQLLNYTNANGSISSLSNIGIGFTQQGTLSFNESTLTSLSQTQLSDAISFLGDPNSGGFLQFANNTLKGVNNSSDGLIATETQAKQAQSQHDQDAINNAQDRLKQLQASLQAQMAAADALIATLQQKNSFLLGLFQYSTSNNPNAGIAG